jgi:hypothetical protein
MSRTKITNPKLLEAVEVEDKFVLNYDGEPLRTSEGNIVSHKSDYLIKRMIGEMVDSFHNPITIEFGGDYDSSESNGSSVREAARGTTFGIYGIQKDLVEQGKDPLENDLESGIRFDRMLYLNDTLKQKPEIQFITRWLKENNCELPNLWPKLERAVAEQFEHYWDMDLRNLDIPNKDLPQLDPQFIATIKELYLSLKPEERAFVVDCYHGLESSDMIFPMAMAAGKCSLIDYECIYFAALELREAFDYIQYYRIGSLDNEIIDEIKAGESMAREFKSTLRWNLRSERNDDEMQYACMKTIAAFLNTDGGQLFIGVSNDGEIIGIEKDGFPDSDKYQLHLFALIKEYLGKPIATSVDTEMVELEEKHICLVKCKKSPKPVYLKFKNKDEAYFVRTGPGTTKLSTSEAHKHITENFES